MNSQVFGAECVFPSEGQKNVTKTLSHPTHVCLSGVRSAHAVEPATPVTLIANTGEFAVTGSGAMAAASLSATFTIGAPRLQVAYPTLGRCVSNRGRLIEP